MCVRDSQAEQKNVKEEENFKKGGHNENDERERARERERERERESDNEIMRER